VAFIRKKLQTSACFIYNRVTVGVVNITNNTDTPVTIHWRAC